MLSGVWIVFERGFNHDYFMGVFSSRAMARMFVKRDFPTAPKGRFFIEKVRLNDVAW